MKKLTILSFITLLLFELSGCKKEDVSNSNQNSGSDYISYTYNGINYKSGLSFTGNGIRIVIPGEPGQQIYFSLPTCAFAIPDGIIYGYNSINGVCTPSLGGQEADPLKVYLYRSGTLSYSYSNCYDSPVMVYGTNGGTRLVRLCTVSGKFDLTLINSNEEIITIRNGTFTLHNIE